MYNPSSIRKLISLSLVFLHAIIVAGQKVSINEHWHFSKGAKKQEIVHIPHSWNNLDVMDDTPGYYRGIGVYKKELVIDDSYRDKQLYLHFEGANQIADVYINNIHALQHIGGYTAFTVPLEGIITYGANEPNEIRVEVDNRWNKNIPPLSADFTFFGGIYRDVYLIAKNRVHFSPLDYASEGVYITPLNVSSASADLHVKTVVNNTGTELTRLTLRTLLYDKQGKVVGRKETPFMVEGENSVTIEHELLSIASPHLWTPESPYLYNALNQLVGSDGEVLDENVNPVGFRWFHFDAETGFHLNGNPCKLIGSSRHQDYKFKANALVDDHAVRDVELLKKMGGNFLRIAHYPQDKAVIQACDRLGILCAIEIPLVNEITETKEFVKNSEHMLMEMLRQYHNHPSLVIWCYMNEILLRDKYDDDMAKKKKYHESVYQLAKKLEEIIREEDTTRYTMHASHGAYEKYRDAGLLDLPMIVGWNLYPGWYGGQFEEFPVFLDRFHAEFPDKITAVTDYGADNDPRIRSDNPIRFDKSTEYSTRYHQYYFKTIMERPFVAAGMIWNLADFNSETRGETMPHINNKGLLTWDRKIKDQYLFYHTLLAAEPRVTILNAGWEKRTGIAEEGENVTRQPLQVASNLPSVELIVNGETLGVQKVTDGLAEWVVPFKDGYNTIIAKGEGGGETVKDETVIAFLMQPYHLTDEGLPFKNINVMLGSTRYFLDPETGEIWMPDQPYREGSFGHTGGEPYRFDSGGWTPFGTDKAIHRTNIDPVYQTQQVGIQAYRFDVPSGQYELTLHFAELEGGAGANLLYNLSSGESTKTTLEERVFDVNVNRERILSNFNIKEQYGVTNAVQIKTPVFVTDKGISIQFVKKQNKPVLNAIQLRRLF
jgi:beta-galactosidase